MSGETMVRFSFFRTLGVAALAVPVAAGVAFAQHGLSGAAKRGTWRVVWTLFDAEDGQNDFRRIMGAEMRFPIRSGRISDAKGERLVLLDEDGEVERTITLGPGEEAMAAPNGSTYLLWTEDPTASEFRTFGYFRRYEEVPDWEVTARGEPILIAEDGSLFLVAERGKGVDTFRRRELFSGGTMQVVGAGGEVRGELPLYPWYAALTGDQRRIVMLHDEELIVLGRDGRLDWDRSVPIDDISLRDGISQLEAAGDVIVVSGTGRVPREPGDLGFQLHVTRRGCVIAYSDKGRRLWGHEQPDDEEYWFQVSAAISPDGTAVATCHSSRSDIVVRLYESKTGKLLWTRSARRGTGFRSLSVSHAGELIVLVHGASTTDVLAWDRAGATVWEGFLPLNAKIARIANDNLLVFDRWIVELTPETEPQ
jgi:WD40 repeat protein